MSSYITVGLSPHHGWKCDADRLVSIPDAFRHSTTTMPHIYGENNFYNPIILEWIPVTLAEECSIHAVCAFAGYQQSTAQKRSYRASSVHFGQDRQQLQLSDAFYHLYESVRLLNKRFENPAQALSNVNMMTCGILAACAV